MVFRVLGVFRVKGFDNPKHLKARVKSDCGFMLPAESISCSFLQRAKATQKVQSENQANKLPLPQPLSSLSPSSSSAKNKQTTIKETMRLEDYGKALLAAYRVMEPATVIVSLARYESSGSKLFAGLDLLPLHVETWMLAPRFNRWLKLQVFGFCWEFASQEYGPW